MFQLTNVLDSESQTTDMDEIPSRKDSKKEKDGPKLRLESRTLSTTGPIPEENDRLK